MTVDDLVTWLRAQLDEDERDAPNVHALDCELTMTAGFHGPCTCGRPARVLAEVDAKREILAKYEGAVAQQPKRPDDEVNRGYVIAMSHAVAALALPYADRPGYRDEWRP